jgi:hypothetical protein
MIKELVCIVQEYLGLYSCGAKWECLYIRLPQQCLEVLWLQCNATLLKSLLVKVKDLKTRTSPLIPFALSYNRKTPNDDNIVSRIQNVCFRVLSGAN